MTIDQQRRLLWKCSWMANGRAPSSADEAYWIGQGKLQECLDRGAEIHDDRYAEKRLLGWQTTGADIPRYGEYAQPPSAYHVVPAYPEDVVDDPGDEEPPPALAQALALLEKQVALTSQLADATRALYVVVLGAAK